MSNSAADIQMTLLLLGNKRDVEFKLGSLHSALRRTLGISRLGRTMSPMRGAYRSPSPSPQR